MKPTLNPEDVFLAFVEEAEIHGEPGALARVAKRLSLPRSTITRMAKRCQFSERYNGPVVAKIQERTNETAATSAAEWRTEAARVGSELVRKGFAALERMQVLSPSDALAAIKVGASMVDRATEPKQKQVNVDVRHILESRFQKLVEAKPLPAPVPRIQVDFGDLDDDLPADAKGDA